MYPEDLGILQVIYVPHTMAPTAPRFHLYIWSEIGVSQESRFFMVIDVPHIAPMVLEGQFVHYE